MHGTATTDFHTPAFRKHLLDLFNGLLSFRLAFVGIARHIVRNDGTARIDSLAYRVHINELSNIRTVLIIEDVYGRGAVMSLDILRHDVVGRKGVIDIAVWKFDRQAAIAEVFKELGISRSWDREYAKAAFVLLRRTWSWSACLSWGTRKRARDA
jgi:hypothetical protein